MNLLKKTFSTAILTISFLLLIYTFYKSEIIWDGANRNYYKTYYLISLILICFSIITFFINNKIKQYLIISAISLLTLLYLFEGYLTYKKQEYSNQKTRIQQLIYEKETGQKWDTRNKLDIYKELKKKNNKIVVSFYPSHIVAKN
jgi:hypothetical protein